MLKANDSLLILSRILYDPFSFNLCKKLWLSFFTIFYVTTSGAKTLIGVKAYITFMSNKYG